MWISLSAGAPAMGIWAEAQRVSDRLQCGLALMLRTHCHEEYNSEKQRGPSHALLSRLSEAAGAACAERHPAGRVDTLRDKYKRGYGQLLEHVQPCPGLLWNS